MKPLSFLSVPLLFAAWAIAGCESDQPAGDPVSNPGAYEETLIQGEDRDLARLGPETSRELARLRSATAKYHRMENALADGYVDISLFIPQMGWHFLKGDLVDATFDVERPELLVYMNRPGGGYRLVAVEYAVPLALSPDPPDGFSGEEDVWDENTGAGLWTLHAWVWYHNPEGIFHPTNPRVN